MNYKIFTDDEILSENFRAMVIKEIEGKENKDRKLREVRKWEIWRDLGRPYVLAKFKQRGLNTETLALVESNASNINIFKKLVSKRARSYSRGLDRTLQSSVTETQALQSMCDEIKMDESMKQLDQYRYAARNCLAYVMPHQTDELTDAGKPMFSLCIRPMFPHLYDAIPDAIDRQKMRCVITSQFSDSAFAASLGSYYGWMNGQPNGEPSVDSMWRRDGVDQTIANSPRDDKAGKKKEYIWWTKKYHMTTDEDGKILGMMTPPSSISPLAAYNQMPFVNFSFPQDGEFWATGGDDIVEETININAKLTDMDTILYMQGFGQFVISGEDVEKQKFSIGPHTALVLNARKGGSPAKAEILHHDPHTENHLKSLQVRVALLLTTNNMSVKTVAADLNASTVASAIAKLVDEAEVMDDISEDQKYYAAREECLFEVIQAWRDAYAASKLMIPEIAELPKFESEEVIHTFHKIEQVVTEGERLANMKLRKELAINTMVDLIKKDNPHMDDESARAKLADIIAEREKLRGMDPTILSDQISTTERIQVQPTGSQAQTALNAVQPTIDPQNKKPI